MGSQGNPNVATTQLLQKRLAKNYTQSARLRIAKSCNLHLCNIYETPNKLLILMGSQFEGLP
jgi:hypothetical protein